MVNSPTEYEGRGGITACVYVDHGGQWTVFTLSHWWLYELSRRSLITLTHVCIVAIEIDEL